MTANSIPSDFEDLLKHASWLQGLAQSLVRDQDLAQDMVQQTWVEALEQPLREGGSSRSWLARVLRNRVNFRHRGEDRRRHREAAVAARVDNDYAGDVVERAEIGRLLFAAVMRLEEPFRTTLLMRFHEGMTPKEIATKTGTPAATVRTRVKRGLGKLRADISQSWGKDWHKHSSALAAFAWSGKPASLVVSPFLLGSGLVAAVFIVAITWQPWAKDAIEHPTLGVSAPPSIIHRETNATILSNPGSGIERNSTAGFVTPVAQDPGDSILIRGRCVAEESGAALEGCRIQVWGSMPRQDPLKSEQHYEWEKPNDLYTDANGVFEITLADPPPEGRYAIHLTKEGRLIREASWKAAINPIQSHDFGDIPMRRGTTLAGRVLTESGVPVEGAWVNLGATFGQALFDPVSRRGVGAMTDANGYYQSESAFPPGNREVQFRTDGYLLVGPTHVWVGDGFGVQTADFILKTMPYVEGVIQFEDGSATPRAYVRAEIGSGWMAAVWTDTEGRFRIHSTKNETQPFAISVRTDGLPLFTTETLYDWGDRDLSIQVPLPLHLDIQVVEASNGNPVESFAVLCQLKSEYGTGGKSGSIRLGGVHPGGLLRVDGLAPGTHTLKVFPLDPHLRSPGPLDVLATYEDSIPFLVPVEVMQPFEVQVITTGGEAVPGSEVTVSAISPEHEVYSKAANDESGIASVYFPPSLNKGMLTVEGAHAKLEMDLSDPLLSNGPIQVIVGGQGRVTGVLHYPESLIPRARLYFHRKGTNTFFIGIPDEEMIQLAPGGHFDLPLEPGTYEVFFLGATTAVGADTILFGEPGWVQQEPPLAEFDVLPEQRTHLDLDAHQFAPGQLSGTILLDGVPQADASFRLNFRPAVLNPTHGSINGGFRTDAQGNFNYPGVMPGNYRVYFRGPDGSNRWPWELRGDDVALVVAQTTADLDFNFHYRTMHVRLLHPDTSLPLSNTSWQLTHRGPPQVTNADGWLTIAPAPAAGFTLRFDDGISRFVAGPLNADPNSAESSVEVRARWE